MIQSLKANLTPTRNYRSLNEAKKAWETGEEFILQTKFPHALNGLLVTNKCFRKEDILFCYNNQHKYKFVIVNGELD